MSPILFVDVVFVLCGSPFLCTLSYRLAAILRYETLSVSEEGLLLSALSTWIVFPLIPFQGVEFCFKWGISLVWFSSVLVLSRKFTCSRLFSLRFFLVFVVSCFSLAVDIGPLFLPWLYDRFTFLWLACTSLAGCITLMFLSFAYIRSSPLLSSSIHYTGEGKREKQQ